jgi:hypothetical protein
MKSIVTVAALTTLLCGPALAQNTGPAPQTGMEKPATTSGAKPDGSMDTTGMGAANGNIKRARTVHRRRKTRRNKRCYKLEASTF